MKLASVENIRTKALWLLSFAALMVSVGVVCIVLYEFGFPIDKALETKLHNSHRWFLTTLWALITIRFILSGTIGKSSTNPLLKIIGYIVFSTISLLSISLEYGIIQRDNFMGIATSNTIVVLLIIVVSITEISTAITRILNSHTNPAVILSASFALIIFVGSLLLQLPNCNNGISYIDSLFVSASAVCVTGLTPIDISSTLTTSGLVILLLLIQIGGLGIMTITSFFGLFFAGGSSISNQVMIGELLSDSSLNGLRKTLLKIIAVTLCVEMVGALMIYFSIMDVEGIDNPMFFSVFHSISAFCNAGFSTLNGNLYDPLVRNLGSLMWIISFLIIFGGIGFPIFANLLSVIWHHIRNFWRRIFRIRVRHNARKWSLNTYIVVRVTLILLVVSWGLFLLLEWNHSLAQYNFWNKMAQGFFAAVTPRTAGFNGVDMNQMLPASILLTIVLMWIGGAPQSTAGGVKVTTIYLALKNIFSSTANGLDIEVYNRSIPNYSVRRAFAVVTLSLIVISVSVLLLSIFEPNIEIIKLIFEAVSAISTVGLTLDVTPTLCYESKVIIIILMYIGRVGIVTLFMTFIKRNITKSYTFPRENILIN